MNSDRIKKIESKLKEIDLEITKIKKRSNLKIKDLQDRKLKLLQKLNADILKMMDGVPGDKIIEAIKKLKSFKD